MKISLLGKGRVGTALSKHFKNMDIPFTHCRNAELGKKRGVVFIAVSDDAVCDLMYRIRKSNPGIYMVHFSASAKFDDERTFLFHPYSSISEDTDISKIIFTFWGKENKEIVSLLEKSGFHFVKTGASPSIFYHISAVISGNFTQYLLLAARELLQKEGFSRIDSEKLLKQLVTSSINNISKYGLQGITGPAARGDLSVIEKETAALMTVDRELAEIFSNINRSIRKAVQNDHLFK